MLFWLIVSSLGGQGIIFVLDGGWLIGLPLLFAAALLLYLVDQYLQRPIVKR